MRCIRAGLFPLLLAPALVSAGESSAGDSHPHWLGVAPGASTAGASRSLVIDRPLQQAILRLAVDHASATLAINGQPVLVLEPFCQTQSLDVTRHMVRGDNRLDVSLTNLAAPLVPPAFALSIDLRFADGAHDELRSDGSWTTPSGSVALVDRGAVADELWGLGRRDLSLSAYDNYEQWQQSKPDAAGRFRTSLQVAPGFQVTELRQAGPDEGSWIAMAFDDAGRLTISREDTGFLRLSFDEARTGITGVEQVRAPLGECRGLVYDGKTLYANANTTKGLFSLVIDDAGTVRDLTSIREFPGDVGHGRNDLALRRRPDGGVSLYSIHGDSVDVPRDGVTDLTSPLRESSTLPAKREGALVRVDLAPGRPPVTTLLHAGLRNPYGIALDREGIPFTFDADNEYDMGTPWYRPTRILQLATGGDSGYREVTGRRPPRFHDQPDHAPQLFDVGRSSPTAVMFGHGLRFPAGYRRALFALDWTYGRVIAVHLFPRGRTFRVAGETFLQGRPLNVTDIAAGPDGAMYLITGGRKTQSALYKVVWTGPGAADSAADIGDGLSEYERGQREAADRAWKADVAAQAADPIARQQHRLDLEHAPPDIETLPAEAVALPCGELLDKLLACARTRSPEVVSRVLEAIVSAPNIPPLETLDPGSQAVWTRIVGLALETNHDAVVVHREHIARQVAAAWTASLAGPRRVAPQTTSEELHRRWACLLGELNAQPLPGLAARSLLASATQEDQLAGLLALRDQTAGWTAGLRRLQFETLAAVPRMVGGAGLPATDTWLRERTSATLSDDERRLLAEISAAVAVPPDEPPAAGRPLVAQWTLDALTTLTAAPPEAADREGSRERGREVYREALCARCHRVGIRGAAVGPDLSFVGRRFSRRDILESILVPSLSVSDAYRLERIETADGRIHVGRIIPEGDYRKETLRLATDILDASKEVVIDKKEIVDHGPQPISPMPSGLLDTFTAPEIADLLTFLEDGG